MMILQTALNYIEENLSDEINYDKMARKCGTNKYNLMRIFSALTDYTLAEYIRMRRLSNAGESISRTKKSIIGIGYDCGYSTAESFSKAYKKFHGITPSETRKTKKYRVVPPWRCDAVRAMKYEVVHFDNQKFLGYGAKFTGKAENRGKQDEYFFRSTRERQDVLRCLREDDDCDWWEILDKFDENGFETACSVKPGKIIKRTLFQSTHGELSPSGYGELSQSDYEKFAEKMRAEKYDYPIAAKEIEHIIRRFNAYVISGNYARFVSENVFYPMNLLEKFTKEVYSGVDGYAFTRDESRPELLKIHWCKRDCIDERRLEIFIPIKAKNIR